MIVNKESFLQVFRHMQAAKCAYSRNGEKSKYCDCKFTPLDHDPRLYTSEYTGCPELGRVIRLIERMTEEEFDHNFWRKPA